MRNFYFVLISIFWGASFIAINISLKAFSPFLAACLRVGISAAITGIFIAISKNIKLPNRSISFQTILNGMVGLGLPWAFLFWGSQYVAPALCSIINASVPIFTVIFAAIIVSSAQDKMTWNKCIGVMIGFIGILIIFAPFISKNSMQSTLGLLAVVGMAFFYGLSIAWFKRLSPHLTAFTSIFLESIGALIVLIPIAVIYGTKHYYIKDVPMLQPILAILYLSIGSTVIAFSLFFWIIKKEGSVEAASVTYMIPITAILIDLIFLKKWIGHHALLGMLVVFAGIKLINRTRVTEESCEAPEIGSISKQEAL